MAESNGSPVGPDLVKDGVDLDAIPQGGMRLGHVGDQAVLLVRTSDGVYAVSATCSHYGGPLAEGLLDGDRLRCPWHHACFSVSDGAVERAPALTPLTSFEVIQRDGRVYVGGERKRESRDVRPLPVSLRSVVIVGGGAAGFAAAETLREEGYGGPVTIVTEDGSPPYDRPNLSKDYLAGNAPEDWLPLKDEAYYAEHDIGLMTSVRVVALHPGDHSVMLADGRAIPYGALLLATGADPIELGFPGAGSMPVHYLRTLDDSRQIIASARPGRRAAVLGASFIGLEVAAALRQRDVAVTVVAPEATLMKRLLGGEMGRFIRSVHEGRGVAFQLQRTAKEIRDSDLVLDNGELVPADFVVIGVGVRPRTELAQAAGLAVDRGILVDEYLATSVTDLWAAGDVARFPYRRSGELIRIEHWVVAQRQGKTAALNMLGRNVKHSDIPFFWSQHYDVPISYVGYGGAWDSIEIDGSIVGRDCGISYRQNGRLMAFASLNRDLDSLRAELVMEREET